mgnify:FL=1
MKWILHLGVFGIFAVFGLGFDDGGDDDGGVE